MMHDTPPPIPDAAPPGQWRVRSDVCPYCGSSLGEASECEACGGLMEPLSRQASQNAMGPWFVRDTEHPFLPGCNLATLRRMAERGKISRATIVRGPSTRQFWMRAERTPGLAHVLGVCHACGSDSSGSDIECRSCGVSFAAAEDRDRLGLSPIRLLPGQASPSALAHQAMGHDRSGTAHSASTGGAGGAQSVATDADTTPPLPLAPAEPNTEPAARTRLSVEERMRRLDFAQAEARERLAEQRERERGRRLVVGIGLGLLALCVLALVLALIPTGGTTPVPAAGAGAGATGGGTGGGATPTSTPVGGP